MDCSRKALSGTLTHLDRTLSPKRQVRNEIDLAGPDGLDAMKVDTSDLRRSIRPAPRDRLVSVDFKRSECLRHLSSTLTEQSNSEDPFLSVPTFMQGCQRCHFRLIESVQGLENNIRRYRNSLAMHVAFLAHCKLLPFHAAFPHMRCLSDSPYFAASTSHFLSGVVRARNKMQRGMWLVERSSLDKPKVVTRHSGVSCACLLVPVVRHSPLHASASALGKGLSQLHVSAESHLHVSRRAPRREHRRGYFLLPPRGSRSRRGYHLPRRPLDATYFEDFTHFLSEGGLGA